LRFDRRLFNPSRRRTVPSYVGIPARAQGRCGKATRSYVERLGAGVLLRSYATMAASAVRADSRQISPKPDRGRRCRIGADSQRPPHRFKLF
jgi:hypothetical protein